MPDLFDDPYTLVDDDELPVGDPLKEELDEEAALVEEDSFEDVLYESCGLRPRDLDRLMNLS